MSVCRLLIFLFLTLLVVNTVLSHHDDDDDDYDDEPVRINILYLLKQFNFAFIHFSVFQGESYATRMRIAVHTMGKKFHVVSWDGVLDLENFVSGYRNQTSFCQSIIEARS